MRLIVPACLLLVALIHAIPAIGLLGPAPLARLYGLPIEEPNLELLMRHRAVLFGLLAAGLAWAAFHAPLHRPALVAGFVSVVSFLLLARLVGPLNSALLGVVRADGVALGLLLIAALVHLLRPGTV